MQEEQVLNFCEITGADPELALKYLQVNDFNLEQAVSLYMENGGSDLVSTDSYQPAAASTQTMDTLVRAPIAPKTQVLLDDDDGYMGGGSSYSRELAAMGELQDQFMIRGE